MMLTQKLLAELRIGSRPPTLREARRLPHLDRLYRRQLYAKAAKALNMPYCNQDDHHNNLIDRLDQDYPGWRGYPVPETEGKATHQAA